MDDLRLDLCLDLLACLILFIEDLSVLCEKTYITKQKQEKVFWSNCFFLLYFILVAQVKSQHTGSDIRILVLPALSDR